MTRNGAGYKEYSAGLSGNSVDGVLERLELMGDSAITCLMVLPGVNAGCTLFLHGFGELRFAPIGVVCPS